jgi:hypothetical protein
VWQTSGGTTQSLGAPDGSATPVGSEGSQLFCPHQPGTWTLTVTGSGGNLHRDRRGVTYAPTATFSLTTLDDPPSCIVMP